MSEARDRLDKVSIRPDKPTTNLERLMGSRKRPPDWIKMSASQKKDFIATRILAEDRHRSGLTSHRALKDTGILSESQYARRLAHEVYSVYGRLDVDSNETKEGNFGRKHSKSYKSRSTAQKRDIEGMQ